MLTRLWILLMLVSGGLSIFLSGSVQAAVIDINNELDGADNAFQKIIQSSGAGLESGDDDIVIPDIQQAKKAIGFLEERLRKNGDIAPIRSWSPAILKLVPKNPDVRYLYAIALASDGKLSSAKTVIAGLKPTKSTRLLSLLANAVIEKSSGNLKSASALVKQAISSDRKHPFAYNIRGQIEIAQGQNQQAVKSFELAIQYAPEFSAAHSNLGMTLYLQGDRVKSDEHFNTSIKYSPAYCPPLIGRSAIAYDRGQFSRAIADLETCLSSEPSQVVARKRLAALYLQVGSLDKAEKLARDAVYIDQFFSQLTLAEIYLRQDQASKARSALSKLPQDNIQVRYLLSFCDAFDQRYDDAREQVRQAERLGSVSAVLQVTSVIYDFSSGMTFDQAVLEKVSDDALVGPLARFVAGNLSASTGDFETAYHYWNDVENLLPGFVFSGLTVDQIKAASTMAEQQHLSLGMLYYLKGYYAAALSEFGRALDSSPNSFLANLLSALTLTQTGDVSRSQINQYLAASLKKVPGFFPANYMYAENALNQGDTELAIRYYEKAASSFPDQGVLVKLGLLYEGQGNYEAAESAYQRFIDNYQQSFLGYNQLAWLYARRGVNLDDAAKLAAKALELRPGNASVNDTLGWVMYQKKDYARAVGYLQEANQASQERNPDILYHLASALYQVGNEKSAKLYLEKALNNFSGFETLPDAKKLQAKIAAPDS